MKRAIVAFVAIVVVALAIMVGKQMSADAMAVIVGIVCGIGASIPTSLVMLMLVRRQEHTETERRTAAVGMPSIMIVNPAAGMTAPYQMPANQLLPPAYGGPAARQFQVVGSEAMDEHSGFSF